MFSEDTIEGLVAPIADSSKDPWPLIAQSLRALSDLDSEKQKPEILAKSSYSSSTTIRLIEFLSASTALIYWSSSTGCHYEEQLWARAIAKKDDICSLSGLAVVPGDDIFRPRVVRREIGNSHAVILAHCLESQHPFDF
jgi:hypothetical protein